MAQKQCISVFWNLALVNGPFRQCNNSLRNNKHDIVLWAPEVARDEV